MSLPEVGRNTRTVVENRRMVMEQQNTNKSKLILGILLFILIIISAIFTSNNNRNVNNLYSNINIDNSKLNIFYFNVGQADSSLIMYEGKTILIDAGNGSDGEEILNLINAKGIDKIDYLIGTHIHEDHIGGMTDIINNFPVERIFMPHNETDNSDFYSKVRKAIDSKGLSIEIVEQADKFYLNESLAFEILYVDNTEPSEPNNASIVVEVTYGEQEYLFMGDAEETVENKMLNKGLLQDIDVLKVGHHGSDTSTTENFLDKILPEISIISVQEGVKYDDIPNAEVLERLEDKSKVYRTDKDGTIWLTSDGKTNSITILENLNLNGANKTALRVYLRYALLNISKFSDTSR